MTTQTAKQKQGPPLPKFAYAIVNPLMKALLYSPLHSVLSKDLLVLSFRGHKSGKRYSIPVGYIQQSNRIYIFSHSVWWKNLQGALVTLRLRGQSVRGTASILKDKATIKQLIHAVIAKRGEAMAQRMGLVDPDHVERASAGMPTIYIEIALDEREA